MKLIEAIRLVAANNASVGLDENDCFDSRHITAAQHFLYGSKRTSGAVRPEAVAIIDKLGLHGDDFGFLGRNTNQTAYANGDKVFKLQSSREDYEQFSSVPMNAIPEGLASEFFHMGECNGIHYSVSERLRTDPHPTVKEIIPWLFKARDTKVTYAHPARKNFGYGKNGEVKALDHEHFQILGQPKGNFEEFLHEALYDASRADFPMIMSAAGHSYVVFDPKLADTTPGMVQRQNIASRLQALGITEDHIENIEWPPVTRIDATETSQGLPLADALQKKTQTRRKSGADIPKTR